MYIKHLQPRIFRTFESFEAEFQPGMNVIAGDNGSGKTALLARSDQSCTPLGLPFLTRKAVVE